MVKSINFMKAGGAMMGFQRTGFVDDEEGNRMAQEFLTIEEFRENYTNRPLMEMVSTSPEPPIARQTHADGLLGLEEHQDRLRLRFVRLREKRQRLEGEDRGGEDGVN